MYRNAYYVLRHGVSEANEQGIIVSDPNNGVPRFGLSEAGWVATKDALQADKLPPALHPEKTVVFTSDFLRAVHTAEVFCEARQFATAVREPRLRERYFGTLELTATINYEKVWQGSRAAGRRTHTISHSSIPFAPPCTACYSKRF